MLVIFRLITTISNLSPAHIVSNIDETNFCQVTRNLGDPTRIAIPIEIKRKPHFGGDLYPKLIGMKSF